MNIIDEPENKLEQLLRLAATEPAHRPEFCQVLMASPLFVLGETGDEKEGEKQLTEGSSLSLQHWEKDDGSTVIPIFTSLEAMNDVIETDERYLEIPAQTLFEMTLGEELILNPESEYSKEFLPAEIETLLAGGMMQEATERVMDDEGEVFIGEPGVYPARLVDSLTTLFSKHRELKSAYLGMIHEIGQEDKPNLIIGLLGDGDLEGVIQEAAAVAWDTTEEDEVVDFMVIEPGDEGISEYFLNETKPFYEGRWGSKMEPYSTPGKA
jgi:hypothetical protein